MSEKLPSINLLLPDHSQSDAWYCGNCRTVHASKDGADRCIFCCCSYCHLPTGKAHQTYHDECWLASWAKHERARFEKAEKLTTYDGWVYCEGVADEYFESIGELCCVLEDDPEPGEWPEYAWACEAIPFPTPDVDSIIEDAVSDMFEDAIEHIEGRDELRAALEAFGNVNRGLISYRPDYKRAVLIPKPALKGDVMEAME